jgi:glycosyltransferase involved in cell wall biosynthesis
LRRPDELLIAGRPPGRSVGIVIRTLNEGASIGTCLESLRGQRGAFELDVLVVDSGSTDPTIEIARRHGARVVELPPGEFDYSTALNFGIENVRGDIVISLSAHAIPVDDGWLATMAAPFEDPRVAGVSSRQVPWTGAPWKEVRRLEQVFGTTRFVYGREAASEVVFSNAASGIRRAVWQEQPFTLPAVEDLEWARRVATAGWTIVYEPGAVVHHSHSEGARAQARRLIDISRAHEATLSPRARRRTIRDAIGLLYRDSRSIVALDEPLGRRVQHLAELLRTVYYYVVDYSRPGTTAEHRRVESPADR